MKFIFSYLMLAIFFGLGLAQQATIQCQCRSSLANGVAKTGGGQLCAQNGGILSDDSELCTRLSQKFTDADCKTLGETYFATCGAARSELKRGIYKREVTPLSTKQKYERSMIQKLAKF